MTWHVSMKEKEMSGEKEKTNDKIEKKIGKIGSIK